MRQNLQRARGKWGKLAKILGREGADRKKVGRFYVTVVKSVLLFGSETWVLTSWLEKSIEGFHHRAVQQMAGMGPKSQWDGTWVYTPIALVLEMVGLDYIRVYITRHQKKVTQ